MKKIFTTRPATIATEKLNQYARLKALVSDVSSMIKDSAHSSDPINYGLFFEGDNVVLTMVVERTTFFHKKGMTADGLEALCVDAAKRIAEARNLPNSKPDPKTLLETVEPPEEPVELKQAQEPEVEAKPTEEPEPEPSTDAES